MKNALLIHGTCDRDEYFSDQYPSLSNSHWFPWLQKQLLINSIFTQTPEMPEAYKPEYPKWKKEFEKHVINKDSILVGHSCGGGFLLRWLSENPIEIDTLILVAPWLDPDDSMSSDFFNFKTDPQIQHRTNQTHMLVSDDDDQDILLSVKEIKKHLPKINIQEFKGLGHFTYESMNSEKFPDLLKLILDKK